MAIHVRDPETDRVVRELARRWGLSLNETVRRACKADLARWRATRDEGSPAPEASQDADLPAPSEPQQVKAEAPTRMGPAEDNASPDEPDGG